jgi:hypothetical protein
MPMRMLWWSLVFHQHLPHRTSCTMRRHHVVSLAVANERLDLLSLPRPRLVLDNI